METEIWKDILGYEGLYMASSLGKIKSFKGRQERILSCCIDGNGYRLVQLRKNNLGNRCSVHRIIAMIFIDKPKGNLQVNHKNGIKTDNRVENLEWCTQSENITHAFRHLGRVGAHKGMIGSLHHSSKGVLQIDLDGEIIRKWGSAHDAQRHLGISQSSISTCCRGIRNKAGGYIWKFA